MIANIMEPGVLKSAMRFIWKPLGETKHAITFLIIPTTVKYVAFNVIHVMTLKLARQVVYVCWSPGQMANEDRISREVHRYRAE